MEKPTNQIKFTGNFTKQIRVIKIECIKSKKIRFLDHKIKYNTNQSN